MYRLGIEGILGLRREGDEVWLEPCIPKEWQGYRLTLRHGASRYEFTVENPHGVSQAVCTVTLDGCEQTNRRVQLVEDGRAHQVTVVLGSCPPDRQKPG